ncbi:hypothetical protein [Virgisporangium aliadipatigenens]|uniref:hypothetical protein n=1 Tax=Virgisporangium aliadipatigenens TaxID=741659 RepID=UPI001942F0B9|nr:hypothetical protein [Virgisporangium aliadipatigenens]
MRRLAGAVAAAAFVGALALPGAAGAHGGAVLTVHGDGLGSVWVTAAYADGHPITSGTAATVFAVAATGERVGPAPLRPVAAGEATLSYAGVLPPGDWTVTAQMAAPATGNCEAPMQVVPAGTTPTPTEKRCGDYNSASPEPPSDAAPPADDDGGLSPWWIALPALLIGAAAVGAYRLQQSRPAAPTRPRKRQPRKG